MKTVLKILLILFAVLIVLGGTSVTIALIYRNEIIKAVLTSVAQNNKVEFSTGDVKLLLSTNLKNTKLLFQDATAKSVDGEVPQLQFEVKTERLYAEVDLLSFVLRREVKIEKLQINGGDVFVRPVLKSNKQNKLTIDSDGLLQGVRQIAFERCRIVVESAKSNTNILISKSLIEMGGGGESVKIRVNGKGTVQAQSKKQKATPVRINISIDMAGKLSQGVATISSGKLNVDGTSLSIVSGLAEYGQPGNVNLSVSGKNLSVEKLIAQAKSYAAFNTPKILSGRMDARVDFNKNFAQKNSSIQIKGAGNVRSAQIGKNDSSIVHVKNLNYLLTSNDVSSLKSYYCALNNIDASIRNFGLNGSLSITNFAKPSYSVDANFAGNMESLKLASVPEGKVNGNLKAFARGINIGEVESMELQMSVEKFKTLLLNEPYIIDGEVSANKLRALPKVNIASQVVNGAFKGEVYSYLEALFDTTQTELKIIGDINATDINLDKLFSQKSQGKSRTEIRATLNTQSQSVQMFDENYSDVSTTVYYNNAGVTANMLNAKAYDGTLTGDIKYITPINGIKRLSCDLYFNDINLEKFSYLNKNFNIKSGSIQGKCDGVIALNSTFNDKGLDIKSLNATATFAIRDGRLLNFEQIQPLSKYIKKKLLDDVRFSSLQNTIYVENGRITIPKMEIRSTALNTFVSGTQELNGDYDYHITLYLAELLSGKQKDIENPIKENKRKLFLRLTSQNGKTNVGLDSEELSKNFDKKLQREAQELRSGRQQGKTGVNSPATAPPSTAVAVDWEEDEKPAEKPKNEPQKRTKQPQQPSGVAIEWDE